MTGERRKPMMAPPADSSAPPPFCSLASSIDDADSPGIVVVFNKQFLYLKYYLE